MKFTFKLLTISCLFFYGLATTHAIDSEAAETINIPGVEIQAISPTSISFSYKNLPASTKVYLVSQFDYKAYELKLKTGARTTGKIAQSIPSKVLNSEYHSQYRLEARNNGSVLAVSEVFQTGKWNKESPNCKIKANKYSVVPGEQFTISWSGTGAEYALAAMGFPKTGERIEYPIKNSLRISSRLAGIHEYGILFQAPSGSQTYCSVFVNVVGAASTGLIDEDKLISSSRKPVITGAATNVLEVIIFISAANEKSGGQVYVSKPITVKKGKWSVKVSPSLPYPNYEYGIELLAYNKGQYAQLDKKSLTIK